MAVEKLANLLVVVMRNMRFKFMIDQYAVEIKSDVHIFICHDAYEAYTAMV